MQRAGGKITVGLGDGESAIEQIIGVDGITDVHNLHRRVDAVNDPLHRAYVMLGESEVGGESDQVIRHGHVSFSLQNFLLKAFGKYRGLD